MDFTTLDQVDAHFNPLIQAAGEDQQRVMALRLERADAREGVRDAQDRDRALTSARADALREFPYARQEELRGDTPEAVRAAAEASHQHVTAIIEQNRQRQAQGQQDGQNLDEEGRRRYGAGAGAAGGGEAPAPPPTAWDAAKAEHDNLMSQIVAGVPFDAREVHQRTMAQAMDAIAERTVKKNVRLLDMGKAAGAVDARQQRGGVQFE